MSKLLRIIFLLRAVLLQALRLKYSHHPAGRLLEWVRGCSLLDRLRRAHLWFGFARGCRGLF
jgi:hypothetical protein